MTLQNATIKLDLTRVSTDDLCKLQMALSASIREFIDNKIDPTAHRELWKSAVEEIVSRNS